MTDSEVVTQRKSLLQSFQYLEFSQGEVSMRTKNGQVSCSVGQGYCGATPELGPGLEDEPPWAKSPLGQIHLRVGEFVLRSKSSYKTY